MLCSHCAETAIEKQNSRCYMCNKLTKQQRVCVSCRSRSSLRRVWWLSKHSGITKELIRDMKFHRKRAYAREFGVILADTLSFVPEDTIVVPIPTASSRIRHRGFDQALLIARAFARQRGLRFASLLLREGQHDQIGKTRKERYEQMQQSFSLKKATIKNANILLIDDVLTSGATLEAAAKLLRQQGARHVDAMVVARQLPK